MLFLPHSQSLVLCFLASFLRKFVLFPALCNGWTCSWLRSTCKFPLASLQFLCSSYILTSKVSVPTNKCYPLSTALANFLAPICISLLSCAMQYWSWIEAKMILTLVIIIIVFKVFSTGFEHMTSACLHRALTDWDIKPLRWAGQFVGLTCSREQNNERMKCFVTFGWEMNWRIDPSHLLSLPLSLFHISQNVSFNQYSSWYRFTLFYL